MAKAVIFDNPEPMTEKSLVASELIELPLAVLSEVYGGDIGSGLVVVPK